MVLHSTCTRKGAPSRSSGRSRNESSEPNSGEEHQAVGQRRPAAFFCPNRDDSVVGGSRIEWGGCRSRTDHGVLLKTAIQRQNRGSGKPGNGKKRRVRHRFKSPAISYPKSRGLMTTAIETNGEKACFSPPFRLPNAVSFPRQRLEKEKP